MLFRSWGLGDVSRPLGPGRAAVFGSLGDTLVPPFWVASIDISPGAGPGPELGTCAVVCRPTSRLVGVWNSGFPAPLFGTQGQVGIWGQTSGFR